MKLYKFILFTTFPSSYHLIMILTRSLFVSRSRSLIIKISKHRIHHQYKYHEGVESGNCFHRFVCFYYYVDCWKILGNETQFFSPDETSLLKTKHIKKLYFCQVFVLSLASEEFLMQCNEIEDDWIQTNHIQFCKKRFRGFVRGKRKLSNIAQVLQFHFLTLLTITMTTCWIFW